VRRGRSNARSAFRPRPYEPIVVRRSFCARNGKGLGCRRRRPNPVVSPAHVLRVEGGRGDANGDPVIELTVWLRQPSARVATRIPCFSSSVCV
jgi:hypothetical protein